MSIKGYQKNLGQREERTDEQKKLYIEVAERLKDKQGQPGG